MTIDEAIKREEELADGHDRIKQIKAVTLEECRRAEEHRQLAEWLKDYQRLLEEQHVDDAKKHFEIICKLSQAYGFNYSFVEEKIKETEKELLKASLQEPCEDAIRRQAVLDINERYHGKMPNHVNHEIWKEIKALPPVTPQPKMGRWIKKASGSLIDRYACSACDKEPCQKKYRNTWGWDFTRYCPNCGRKMQGVEE